jgi:murein DD-endopeptidase MepM/ murein hydrolase activator NlpD
MAFVMFATGATSTSRVRSLPMAPLVLASIGLATTLLATGACFGYWLARTASSGMPVAAVMAPDGSRAPADAAAVQPFALEQLGALSARLFRLESEAAQLGERLGVKPGLAAPKPAAIAQPAAPQPGSAPPAQGGPWLAPRADAADVDAFEAALARAEDHLADLAAAASQRTLQLMRLPTRLPIANAELTSGFGNRIDPFAHTHAFHAGLDFAAEVGAPIAAAAGGTVSFAGFKSDYGNVVEIDHGNGLVTRYAHASRLLVQAGDVVEPGQRIARVGSTGRATGPHLHFEVLRAGSHVDPKRYLAGL